MQVLRCACGISRKRSPIAAEPKEEDISTPSIVFAKWWHIDGCAYAVIAPFWDQAEVEFVPHSSLISCEVRPRSARTC